jgi:hypothetical protein
MVFGLNDLVHEFLIGPSGKIAFHILDMKREESRCDDLGALLTLTSGKNLYRKESI